MCLGCPLWLEDIGKRKEVEIVKGKKYKQTLKYGFCSFKIIAIDILMR